MKKTLLSLFVIHSSLFIAAASAAEYNAALVADMDTGQVVYSEHANDLNYPASLTKIMTLYLTFDALEHGRLRLDQNLIVSKSAAAVPPVKLGISAGSKISVDSAIKAVAVHSANDVAKVLAENLVGDEGNFSSLMTRVAKEIGLSKTNFENSSGLPDDDHLSSARDIALLSMAVYKHFPQYWYYFSTRTFSWDGKTYVNTNSLLSSYPGCDGMKTGYTNKSRYSLVATANRGGRRIMSVVLGAQSKEIRAAVSRRMLDKGFGTESGGVPSAQENLEKQTAKVFHPVSQKGHEKLSSVVKGVQFGAFSSRGAAETQAAKVKSQFGISCKIEQNSSGLWRVRTYGMSNCPLGIECFKFH